MQTQTDCGLTYFLFKAFQYGYNQRSQNPTAAPAVQLPFSRVSAETKMWPHKPDLKCYSQAVHSSGRDCLVSIYWSEQSETSGDNTSAA